MGERIAYAALQKLSRSLCRRPSGEYFQALLLHCEALQTRRNHGTSPSRLPLLAAASRHMCLLQACKCLQAAPPGAFFLCCAGV